MIILPSGYICVKNRTDKKLHKKSRERYGRNDRRKICAVTVIPEERKIYADRNRLFFFFLDS
jgi:hypothetical protein